MRRVQLSLIFMALTAVMVSGQTPDAKPAWNVTLEANKTASSNITVQNRCQGSHSFELERQEVPFLEIGQTEVQVGGGANAVVPVRFNTTGLAPSVYQGRVLVICLTCSSEPTCSQDREVLPVVLTVTGGVADDNPADDQPDDNPRGPENLATPNDPCVAIEDACDDLRIEAERAEGEAAGAQDAADAARTPADAAETAAKDAEEASKNADEAATDEASDYRAKVDDQEYSSADVAYRLVLQAEINRAHKAGETSNADHKSQTEANTTKKAREERLKNLEQLKADAAKAKKAAEEARKAADEAKKVADAAQKAADEARKAADAARKAYDECVKKLKEACEKAEKEQAQREADAKAAAAGEAKARAAEEARKAAEERDAKEVREETKYLLDNIQQLGLIDSSAIKGVPSIWQWLPDWLETPVATLVENQAAVPIPTDTLKALGGLYGIVGKLLDPCTAAGKAKTIARLETMINPKTNRKYEFLEAFDKTEKMCKLMRKIRSKLVAIRKEQERRGMVK